MISMDINYFIIWTIAWFIIGIVSNHYLREKKLVKQTGKKDGKEIRV